jgi:DNA-binding CsgD family transcriptional regulator
VAKRLIAGESTAKIAQDMFISIKTVEAHRMKIMAVLEIRTIAELIRWANDRGLLSLMGWDSTRPKKEGRDEVRSQR